MQIYDLTLVVQTSNFTKCCFILGRQIDFLSVVLFLVLDRWLPCIGYVVIKWFCSETVSNDSEFGIFQNFLNFAKCCFKPHVVCLS